MIAFGKRWPCCYRLIYIIQYIHTDIVNNEFVKCLSAFVAKEQAQFQAFQVTLREE